MSVFQRSIWGMLTGAGSVVIKTGLNIVVLPVLIAKLGLDGFGLYLLLLAIFEMSSLLDLGATSALVTLLGGDSMENGVISETRRAILNVGHTLLLGLSLVFLLVGLFIYPSFSSLFQIDASLHSVAQLGFLLIVLEASLTLYSCYSRSVLLAHSAHQWTNLADTIYSLIANAGALVLLVLGFGLPEVLMLRLAGSLVRLLFMLLHTVRLEPAALMPRAPFQRKAFQEVLHLCGHATMINFSIIVSHKIDDLVIARFLPIGAVGIYEIVFRFLGVAIQVCLKLHEGIYPLFARMAALSQKQDARQLFLRISSFLNLAASTMLMLVVIYYSKLFSIFSAGKIPVAQTFPILAIAVPCVLSGVLQMPANAWLFTWGRQRFVTVTSLIAALANLTLSLVLVQYWGIVGVALGTLIPQLLQHQAGLIRETCLNLEISFWQYMRAVHGAVLIPLLLGAGWVWLWSPFMHMGPSPIVPIMLTSAGAAMLSGLSWFQLTASTQERQLVRNLINQKLLQSFLKRNLATDNAS